MQLKSNNNYCNTRYYNNQQHEQQQQQQQHLTTTTMAASLLNVVNSNIDGEHVGGNAGGANNNVDTLSRCSANSNNNNNNNMQLNHLDESHNSNNNNNNNLDANEVKQKRQTLEQRKQELEKLLTEKTWLLQQLQKQELQILQGNYEYVNLNEIFHNLTQQYRLEQQQHLNATTATTTTTPTSSSILRRKSIPYNNNNNNSISNNNNNNSNNHDIKRQSEISNRSSEYDNYPGVCVIGVDYDDEIMHAQLTPTHTPTTSNKLLLLNKKRATPTANNNVMHINLGASNASLNYAHLQRQHCLQQQSERQMLQQHLQQQQQQQQQQVTTKTADAISLYSVNSSNVATLRQQHVAPQQQPIVVQYEKYCLSPTHQTYAEGSFIKSSQNIKRYVSPLSSPNQPPQQPQQPQQQQQQQQQLKLKQNTHFRPLDAVSLANSYLTNGILDTETAQALRWRSQSNTLLVGNLNNNLNANATVGNLTNNVNAEAIRSHSSDMLSYYAGNQNSAKQQQQQQQQHHKNSNKHLDEISICSMSSENQKKQLKTKMWLESSLDGPIVRATCGNASQLVNATAATTTTAALNNNNNNYVAAKVAGHKKLSSHSMCAGSSGRHYSMSAAQKHMFGLSGGAGGSVVGAGGLVGASGGGKLLQDEDKRYMKLSQSTSYLNALEAQQQQQQQQHQQQYDAYQLPYEAAQIERNMLNYRYLPPKPPTVQRNITPPPPPRLQATTQMAVNSNTPTPPPPPLPLPLSTTTSVLPLAAINVQSDCTSPVTTSDIRIESPKNMTVITPATFQPYKEVTKPFEMSDFYKYSTKFRQKDGTADSTVI